MTPTTAMKPRLVEKDSSPVSVHVRLDLIAPSPTNRRTSASADLIASIKKDGVTSDVLLRPVIATEEHVILAKPNGKFSAGQDIYEIVFGERRYWGSVANKFETIPAKVRNLSDADALRMQIDENENRQDLAPMERAQAYEHLRKQFMKDHEGQKYSEGQCIQDMAADRNVETRIVYQVLALLKLHIFVQAALNQEEMGISHAYEFCRLEGPQQIEVLAWLRKETQHSQGDVPSVRRLKRWISDMAMVWESKKRQAELPLEGDGAKAQTSAEDEELANPSLPRSAMDEYRKQKSVTPAQPKPLSKAQIKKNEAAEAVEKLAHEKRQRKVAREARIDKHYRAALFAALASRVQISSRFLSRIVPQLVSDLWDAGDVPFDQTLARTMGWPMPVNPEGYVFSEWREHSRKHTRKFTPGLLGALVMSLNMIPFESERLGRYFNVDTKRLRAHAAATVKAEEKAAKLTDKKKAAA